MAERIQSRSTGRFSRALSTCISGVNYNPLTSVLRITFHNPTMGTWEYENVGVYDAAGLIEASSRGEYFNQFIRNNYQGSRIS